MTGPWLDPRWQWVQIQALCETEPRYIKGPCNHLETVPVEQPARLGGEVVAWLCLTCDQQLPAEWGHAGPARSPLDIAGGSGSS